MASLLTLARAEASRFGSEGPKANMFVTRIVGTHAVATTCIAVVWTELALQVCAGSAMSEKKSGLQANCLLKCHNDIYLKATCLHTDARAAGEQGITCSSKLVHGLLDWVF